VGVVHSIGFNQVACRAKFRCAVLCGVVDDHPTEADDDAILETPFDGLAATTIWHLRH